MTDYLEHVSESLMLSAIRVRRFASILPRTDAASAVSGLPAWRIRGPGLLCLKAVTDSFPIE